MAKPSGPLCNIDCSYCFYVGKTDDYDRGHTFAMSDQILETYIRDSLAAHPGPEVHFAWQGGEPTLMGIEFFEKVLKIQARLAPTGTTCLNAVQTNAIRLNAQWGRLFADPRFLIGVSIDGPADVHDHYRRDRSNRGTHTKVMRGIEILHAHGVQFNTLTVEAVS